MKNIIILLLTVLLYSATTHAQVEKRFMGWGSIISNTHINQHWGIQLDMNFRTTDAWENRQTVIIRPGVSYKFNKKYSLVAGYANVSNRKTIGAVTGYTTEHQIWQQFWIRSQAGKFNVTHRLAFDGRILSSYKAQNNHLVDTSTSFALRFRYLLRAVLPWHESKEFKKGMYNFAQQELLMTVLNKKYTNGYVLDQVRPVIGIGYRFSSKADLETGFQYRYLQNKGGSHAEDAILQTSCFLRF